MSSSGSIVVLVEDNPADAFLVQEAIERYAAGAELLLFRDGEAAIRFIDRAEADEAAPCPALVLLDLNLPTKTGEEILAYIRRSSRCARVPVVVVTSSDSPEDRKRAQILGANRYFRKPSDYDEFMQIGRIVSEMLAKSIDAETEPGV